MNSALNKVPEEAVPTIELAQQLVRLDTSNPPGNETLAAKLIADRLVSLGVDVQWHELEPGRDSIVAHLNPGASDAALCLCGHLDTVPLGSEPWKVSALSGEISEYRMWGRGTTDMKCGVAAMVTAFERLRVQGSKANVVLALLASEETGCQGAVHVVDKLPPIGALVIAEPTNGELAIGHKGVLWLKLTTKGKAAHGSMPHLGVNAIDIMSTAISSLRSLSFGVASSPLLGDPTYNVGTVSGGSGTNIVPDRCECTVDIRLIPGLTASHAKKLVAECVGGDVEIETVLALDAVACDPDDAWIQSVTARTAEIEGRRITPTSVSYFTDGSVLVPALNSPPIAIVGPGDPALAHKVNESCSVTAIWRASQLYERLALDWTDSNN
ncbi:M20 family metallopeptidase [Agrobacterium sp. LAD9]|uniref:M20 family metallopeptidase n=1 Tax=Agrobacterium sp. LAD9 TaxID=2055153 RepID=UPI001863D919|nr:M20 family metallopeptidase [Agrobacterium sp. LAD9]